MKTACRNKTRLRQFVSVAAIAAAFAAVPPAAFAGYVQAGLWGGQGEGDGQFNFPADVAVDGSGNVYVADTNNNRVQKFTSAGAFLTQWGGLGSGAGQFNGPRAVGVDGSGNVYVADTNNNRIQKFTSNGQLIAQWNGSAQAATMSSPSGIEVTTGNIVYVADTGNSRVLMFTNAGSQLINMWGGLGSGDGKLSFPTGIATDDSGAVYVADTANSRVQKFTWNGTYISQWGSTGSLYPNQFVAPVGIAADPAGNVYLSDSGNDKAKKFESSGDHVTSWGGNGADPGELDNPLGLDVDGSGAVYIADSANHRIQKFTEQPDGAQESPQVQQPPATPDAPAPSGAGSTDSAPPLVSGFRAAPRRLRAPKLRRRQGRLVFSYRLSEDAGVRLKVRRDCKRRCSSRAIVARSTGASKQGKNTITARAHDGRLRPGRYLASLVATDASGNSSREARTSITVTA